jgi:uncharacterized membrane protein
MSKVAGREGEELTIGRVEGFSDAVLAIAATLLAVQLGTGQGGGSLAHRLSDEWPAFLSYFISFMNIGTVWLNHHKAMSRLDRVDHTFVLLNLMLLMVVSFLPFPTRVIGDQLAHGTHADQRTAALLYSGTFLLASIAFYVLCSVRARLPGSRRGTRGERRDHGLIPSLRRDGRCRDDAAPGSQRRSLARQVSPGTGRNRGD